ncbi:16S rRNA (cytosine(1402)-N(4))-methyltransferase RsmH [Mariniluteicoccus endophyticus]
MEQQPTARHVPVMCARIADLLEPALTAPGSIHVDCTLGLGGHVEAVLERCPQARVIGIDRDPQAIAHATARLERFGDRFTAVEAVYDEIGDVLDDLGVRRVQGILADLGLSSLQIDRTDRGFAYATDAPLDMRMDTQQDVTAATLVNTWSAGELARILKWWGEERFADRIARRIVASREADGPFTSSARLVQVVADAIPAAARKTGGHPAKRTFQALRIEVNRELEVLDRMLPAAVSRLAVGGRIAVLAYHSLEDRAVKHVLRRASESRAPRDLPVVPAGMGPELRLVTRGAEKPAEEEIATNPRAASARLRVAERIEEA